MSKKNPQATHNKSYIMRLHIVGFVHLCSDIDFEKCTYIFVLEIAICTVASFTKEVNPWLAKRPLKTNGRLANRRLTFLVKEATDDC